MSVVIPVVDAGGLHLMLRGLPPVLQVVVVGADASLRSALVGRPDVVLVQPARPGLGNAIAAGVRAARGDVVVTLNGDASTDPAEIPRFVAALVAGADVALGSRYSAGGRDLTGRRLHRWANLALIWILARFLGIHRTDPGFGYAAFWRDAAHRLGLPDPAPRTVPVWGEGPEIGPLLALRPAMRGLRVAEVGSTAYPPVRRARDTERLRLRHWLRTARQERRSGVEAETPAHPAPVAHRPVMNDETGAGRRALDRWAIESLAHERRARERLARERTTVRQTPAPARPASSASARPAWAEADRRSAGRPAWGQPHVSPAQHIRNTPPAPRREGHPERLGGPDLQPRSGQMPWRIAFGATQPTAREVGTRRRRIQGLRQDRPDLRVINGEGATTGRRARLRSIKKLDE
ncbi:glycosyltransferase family 2 protein [Actinoplanes bogorensis]|uniref:Glycosyltransferase family 2 protein n=1 Tax=Paractinoplanes bogorensis TaxID=1610840 RepID=A0ABS5YT34_9ACTN|nr:glycosyltransferase family 2 protein [Actinoplanes bogorensis]MBU2666518.1 glycosyltransferase family 2 protein [Actinoplanes bogorensis]